jgi:two-component sensor histidine kinase
VVHRPSRFDHWSTATKLLVLLTLALFPLGVALAWTARLSLKEAHGAALDVSNEVGQVAARAAESLIARNALALQIAANGALRSTPGDPCVATAQSLALTPAIESRFSIRDSNGTIRCLHGGFVPNVDATLVAPGASKLWISQETRALRYRVGINGGMATGELPAAEFARVVREFSPQITAFSLTDGRTTLEVIGGAAAAGPTRLGNYPITGGQVTAIARTRTANATFFDQVVVFLPLLMWGVAALLSWFLVRRLLLVPLGRLERAVGEYRPGEGALVLPERLGGAHEIRSLGGAFERAVDRLESSEQKMAEALHGQRRLVREVHHRVKNNLQVIASLLNIHGRNATTPESGAAYAAIGRRVDALSVVHRNHFAEVEENRGIALRPLLHELGEILRASAPASAAGSVIQLNADSVRTTQDAAVAVAFFVTELIEFAMLQGAAQPIEIELKRTSELAASLTVSSDALILKGDETSSARSQFERVIGGLARQLRSPLEQTLGRMSVTLPVFPD